MRCLSSFSSKFRKKYCISELIHHGSFAQKKEKFSISENDWSEDSSTYEKAKHIQLLQGFENVISALCTSDGSRNCEDVNWEMNSVWEMLHNKPELKYSSAKQEILQQLLKILSSSKRESEIRVSVSILLGLISVDKTIIDDIKRENFHLYNLATALKRNVHEAAILIYLLNPSPSEIRSLELLPDLVEVACNSNKARQGMRSLSITSTSASIAMIEILVTAFDYVTNNMHLAAISSPQVLTKLVNVAMNNDISEGVALATILMRCMRLNGNCRKFLSQVTPIDPFIHLLGSNKMSAKSAALEYFHELLWNRMAAKVMIKYGRSVFCALAKGIQSQRQSVQRDCLITAAWLGSEMAVIRSRSLKYSACEILLDEVAAFLHPGTQLDERVLACLSVYNYTSGKGKEKLLNFSEGLRESLRRLSGVTWMAEELLNVTDYFLPTKPRVSCVHTQILEIANIGNGSATALIFYKGHLYTGYSDGSIKAWDIKGQQSVLLWEVKMHKKSVTCFTVYEPADSLLSGSTDKTIRVWRNAQKKLECVEVIQVKEPVQKIGAYNEKILIVTQSRGLKVCQASRSIQTVCKNKHVTSFAVFQGKIYLGCTDSSIQEIHIEEENEIEIRAPTTNWKMQRTPINSICVFKGWVYCAGASVEGSNAKDWRRRKQPLISIKMSRRNNVQAMLVAEDFFYLSRSSSPSTVQIFLREKQQSVGRLSAGSKVTSLLTANDIILCGTEAGLVKGWIPL